MEIVKSLKLLTVIYNKVSKFFATPLKCYNKPHLHLYKLKHFVFIFNPHMALQALVLHYNILVLVLVNSVALKCWYFN